MLPNELWWRLQYRLMKHAIRIAFQSPRFADEEYLMDLKEAGECHSLWLDGMWLGNPNARIVNQGRITAATRERSGAERPAAGRCIPS